MTAIQERPVAWAVNHAHGTTVWDSETKARKVADEWLASGVWIWAEVVPLYRQPRWIPVSERLPDRRWDGFSDIVVVAAENSYFLGRYYRCDIGDECHECDADIGERWYIETTAKPTHWMPLPEPPEAKA